MLAFGYKNNSNGNITNNAIWKGVKDLCDCKFDEVLDERNQKQSKQDGSVPKKCNFDNVIKISREWCKGNDVNSIAHMLGIPKSSVNEVYYKASDIAENFIRSNIKDWQIGGPGVIVIVDTYPEGCTNTNLIGRRAGRPILCISEVKSFPQKYWLEALDTFDSENTDQINTIKQHILKAVRSIVLPGSILVTPYLSTLLSHTDFAFLKPLYPTIVSVRDLAKHNTDTQSIFSNLATIWKPVLDVCEEAQFFNSVYIRHFIVSHMWRRRYGERSFEVFLYQLSTMQ